MWTNLENKMLGRNIAEEYILSKLIDKKIQSW